MLCIGGDVPLATGELERAGAHSLGPRRNRQGRLHGNAVMAQCQYEVGHIEEARTTWSAPGDGVERGGLPAEALVREFSTFHGTALRTAATAPLSSSEVPGG